MTPQLLPLLDRLLLRTHKTDSCWFWTGAKNSAGYGVLRVSRRNILAHRLSYEQHGGRQIPALTCVLHSCDTPACVNPAHLSIGSKRANADDMTRKGRRASKLTRVHVLEIRARHEEGVAVLAVEFGVSESTIRSVLAGKSWR